jgi:transposase
VALVSKPGNMPGALHGVVPCCRSECAWRALPADFPPWPTVYHHFHRWQADGTTARIHQALRTQVRQAAGRDAEPAAAVIDSQSVRAADTVPKTSRGWDNAKKVNGRKRHIAVDTTGLVLDVVITAASIQDRDAARPLLWNLRGACAKVRLVWADGGYQAGRLASWATTLGLTVQIVRRPDDLHTFAVLPRRWVVERTFAWISKYRRTVRDYEKLPGHHAANNPVGHDRHHGPQARPPGQGKTRMTSSQTLTELVL